METRFIGGNFRGVKEGEGGAKVYTFVASTPDPDRHSTVLNQKNWRLDNYKLNPIIGYQHNVYGGGLCNAPDPDDVIGRGVDIYVNDNDELILDMVFDEENEKAVKVQSKVDRGFLNTVSVGFIETGDGHRGNEDDGEDKELYYFHGQELLEISIVNIPSNPKAAKKQLRSSTYDALQYIYRELGGEYRLSEIETLTVRDILDLLDGKQIHKDAPVSATRKRIRFFNDKGELVTDLTMRS